MTLTAEQLKKIVPAISGKNLKIYLPLLNEVFSSTHPVSGTGIAEGIGQSKERICCFIAQVAHESGSFNYVKEIASGKAYEGRSDLGNTEPGDGVKFKGRGLIQITGKTNYKRCSLFLFGSDILMQKPEMLEQPEYALKSACWYWSDKKLNTVCDAPDEWKREWRGKVYNKFQWLTIKINGGLNGYNDRIKFYERALKALA